MAVGYGGSIGAERVLPLNDRIVWIWTEMFIAFWEIFSGTLTFFFNIFFINDPFFYFDARKLAYQGEMKCLSNVILTMIYSYVRKCHKRCQGSVDLNED